MRTRLSDMAADDEELASVTQQNLDQYLADIHLPDPVGWWPLAPGWWLLVALFLLLCGYFLLSGRYRSVKNSIEFELRDIYRVFEENGNAELYSLRISRLLREQANNGMHKKTVAPLQGDLWVNWMEEVTGIVFSSAARQFLKEGCYQLSPAPPDPAMHNELSNWVKLYARSKLNRAATDA